MALDLDEIEEAMNQSHEESTRKKLEEESDEEAPLEATNDVDALVADMSGFCLKSLIKTQIK